MKRWDDTASPSQESLDCCSLLLQAIAPSTHFLHASLCTHIYYVHTQIWDNIDNVKEILVRPRCSNISGFFKGGFLSMLDAKEDARSRSLRQCTVRRFSSALLIERTKCPNSNPVFVVVYDLPEKRPCFFQRDPCLDHCYPFFKCASTLSRLQTFCRSSFRSLRIHGPMAFLPLHDRCVAPEPRTPCLKVTCHLVDKEALPCLNIILLYFPWIFSGSARKISFFYLKKTPTRTWMPVPVHVKPTVVQLQNA